MGLDMYLYKKTYVNMDDEQKHQITVLKNNQLTHIKPERINYIVEEVGYWRKANAIHKWFVDNVQNGVDDCKEYLVEIDDLEDLKSLCEKVLESKDLAEELLPSESGFFFGSTEYDESYFKYLEQTLDIINKVLSESIESKHDTYLPGDIYYNSSW